MFSTAKSLPTAKTAKAKSEKLEFQIPGIRDLAVLKALIVTATALAATLETSVKDDGFEKFMELRGGTPRITSFRGLERDAACGIEMRKRGTNSPLSEAEIVTLEAAGITPFEQIVQQELYAFNPIIAADAAKMALVEKALRKAGFDDNLIVKQEEIKKFVVSEEMLEQAYKLKTQHAIAAMGICTTMALKPALSSAYEMANLITDAIAVMQPAKKKTALPTKKAA